MDLLLGVVVGVVKFALKFLDTVDNLLTEIMDITEELVDSLIDCIKSAEVSVHKGCAELLLECSKGGPSLGELLLESLSKSSSDMGGKESELFTSGLESGNELTTAGWEFSKEEIDSGLNLLSELLIIDTVGLFGALARVEDFFNLFFDLFFIDGFDVIDAWGLVLVLVSMARFIILFE